MNVQIETDYEKVHSDDTKYQNAIPVVQHDVQVFRLLLKFVLQHKTLKSLFSGSFGNTIQKLSSVIQYLD